MWGVPLTGAGKADDAEADPAPPPAAAGEAATGGEKKKKKKETFPIESAVELNEKLEAEQAKLADLEAASQTITPFERRLGEALRREQMSLDKKKTKKEAVNTLMRSWDKNGDGEISKKEFRDAMPLLGMDLPTKAIDSSSTSTTPTSRASWSLPSCSACCASRRRRSAVGARPRRARARPPNSRG